ncbi:biopolymer transporter ExbD [Lewinellaceae bacterium SD302]|nr:biopolymer transporter ExbD [Lewinellaceae bacterium SD302]
MPIKKRAKVNAEFSMSSLTDIIFLLLIFFMLTSTVVAPNALNLKLPSRSNSQTPPSDRNLDKVRISSDGFFFNGRRIDEAGLDSRLSGKARSNYSLLIAPDEKAPIELVVVVMDLARRYEINGVLAAEK